MRNKPRAPFVLEQTYREQFSPNLFDLSSSAPSPSNLNDLFRSDESCNAFLATSLSYGAGGGDLDLRRAIASLYNDDLPPENVLVTAGGLEAIRVAAMAVVRPSSSALVQAPSYAALAQAVQDCGGSVIDLEADADGHFDLTDCPQVEVAFLNSPYGLGGVHVRGMESFKGRLIVDEVYGRLSWRQELYLRR